MRQQIQRWMAGLVVLLSIGYANATPVYHTPVDPNAADPNDDFTGMRTYQDEGGLGSATIEWIITQNGNEFTYRYIFHIPDVAGPTFKDVSHFTLDISDDFDEIGEAEIRNAFESNSNDAFDPQDESDIEFGSHDGLTGDVKFDFGGGKFEDGVINTSDEMPLYYEFTTTHSPVWGNHAVKAGTAVYTNAGLGNEGTSMDEGDFIAVPDGANGAVPEPSSLGLACLGAFVLVSAAFRRRRRVGHLAATGQ